MAPNVTLQEIMGYWPQFALGGNVSDRNTVAARDLSGLRPVHNPHHGGGSILATAGK